MQFKVVFVSESGKPIQIERKSLGVEKIKEVRKELGIKNLPIHIFSNDIPECSMNAWLYPTLEQAEECGFFKETDQVEIFVQEKGLNEFTLIKTIKGIDTRTQEITNIYFEFVLKKEEIWEAWKKDGYPLMWKIKGETKNGLA